MNLNFLHQRKLPASIHLLLVVVLLALNITLRLGRYAQLEYQSRDSHAQITLAKLLISGHSVQTISAAPELKEALGKPPLLIYVMMLEEKCGIDAEKGGTAFVLLCGILLPCVLALLAHELFEDWRYTLGTLLLSSVFPPLVRFSCLVQRDMPYWFLCALSIWFAIRAERKKTWRGWIAFGITSALAVLARREGLELILAWGLWLAVSSWGKTGSWQNLRHKFAIFCTVLLPWLIIAVSGQCLWNSCGSNWQLLPLKSLSYYWSRLI